MFLVQTVGEFKEKTEKNKLDLQIKKPGEPIYIMADGRHFWRVIDNLMNNICKYAQPETRVYINLEQTGEKVQITFRNTSRYPVSYTHLSLLTPGNTIFQLQFLLLLKSVQLTHLTPDNKKYRYLYHTHIH